MRKLAVLLIALLFAACQQPAADGPLIVLGASSLDGVLTPLTNAWGQEAVASTDGSQVLRAQIDAGVPAGVFISARLDIAEDLVSRGKAGPPVLVAKNSLIIVGPADAGFLTPADLGSPGLRLVLADPAVPLGAYTQTALDDTDLSAAQRQSVDENIVSLESSARSVTAKLVSGAADAAVLYTSDAPLAIANGLRVSPWPFTVEVTYYAQVITNGDAARSQRFLDFITSDEAAPIWSAAGLVPTPR